MSTMIQYMPSIQTPLARQANTQTNQKKNLYHAKPAWPKTKQTLKNDKAEICSARLSHPAKRCVYVCIVYMCECSSCLIKEIRWLHNILNLQPEIAQLVKTGVYDDNDLINLPSTHPKFESQVYQSRKKTLHLIWGKGVYPFAPFPFFAESYPVSTETLFRRWSTTGWCSCPCCRCRTLGNGRLCTCAR